MSQAVCNAASGVRPSYSNGGDSALRPRRRLMQESLQRRDHVCQEDDIRLPVDAIAHGVDDVVAAVLQPVDAVEGDVDIFVFIFRINEVYDGDGHHTHDVGDEYDEDHARCFVLSGPH